MNSAHSIWHTVCQFDTLVDTFGPAQRKRSIDNPFTKAFLHLTLGKSGKFDLARDRY